MNRAIEHWDDERASDGGIVVTLHYGWSFDPKPYHEGVRGFDTVREAKQATAIKNLSRCDCALCSKHIRS